MKSVNALFYLETGLFFAGLFLRPPGRPPRRIGHSFPALWDGGLTPEERRYGLLPGDRVSGTIDSERRYKFMRSHTACHILSAVIFQETGAKITGNQIEQSRSRVDFSLESFDKAKMSEYVEKANGIVDECHAVTT